MECNAIQWDCTWMEEKEKGERRVTANGPNEQCLRNQIRSIIWAHRKRGTGKRFSKQASDSNGGRPILWAPV